MRRITTDPVEEHEPIKGVEDNAYRLTYRQLFKDDYYAQLYINNPNTYANWIQDPQSSITRNVLVREWESLWNYLDTAVNFPSKLDTSERASRSPGDTEWSGASWQKAVDMAMGAGWPEGTHYAREFADDVRYEIEDEYQMVFTPSVQHNLGGSFVDVGRYLAGEPEAMMDILVEEKSKPVVKILINTATSYRVKPEAIIRRGAITVALVDLLEDMGMRCEVIAVTALDSETYRKGATNGLQYFVTVKRPDATLQLGALMFMIAHPASFRRITFSVMETENAPVMKDMNVHKWGGYGKVAEPIDYPHDIYVPALLLSNDEFNTDEGAKMWLLDVLRDQGLTFLKNQQEVV